MKSDLDLLAVKTDGEIQLKPSKRSVSLHEYPFETLMKKAVSGDLFLLHLVSEGVALSDPLDLLAKLKSAFEFKNGYVKEKKEAAAIIWYCNRFLTKKNEKFVRKRLVWAIRTLIISDAAERGLAVFSSSDLEEYSEIEHLKEVLDNRKKCELSLILAVAKQAQETFYRKLRPADRETKMAIDKWMVRKGKMAGSTPAYLEGKKSREFWDIAYL